MSLVGDIDGDGHPEWVTSSYNAELVEVFTIRSLFAEPAAIEAASSYRVDFELNVGVPRAGNPYLLLAGVSGTSPGIPVHGKILPLNFDLLTDVSILFANTSPFHSTLGTASVDGDAEAWFDGSLLPPAAVGATLSFAYYTAGPGGVSFSTNPVEIPVLQTP